MASWPAVLLLVSIWADVDFEPIAPSDPTPARLAGRVERWVGFQPHEPPSFTPCQLRDAYPFGRAEVETVWVTSVRDVPINLDAAPEWSTTVALDLAFSATGDLVVCVAESSDSLEHVDSEWLGRLTRPDRLIDRLKGVVTPSATTWTRTLPTALSVFSGMTGPLSSARIVVRPRGIDGFDHPGEERAYWIVHGFLPALSRSTVYAIRDEVLPAGEGRHSEFATGMFLDGTTIPPYRPPAAR